LRISRRRFKPKPVRVVHLVNDLIRFPQVRVIDENDQHLGVLDTQVAIQTARSRELDLVVIQPKAEPPVARIVDFGKYRYEQDKEARKQKAKQKSVEVKGIRLSVRIGQHDRDVRKEQAKKFLDDGDKVKVEIILRGREKGHGQLGIDVINEFIKVLNADMPVKIEQPITRQGGQLTAIVGKA
jgi:translation initiation factor IF-3